MKSPGASCGPIVFVVDDDASVREAVNTLVRSVGLGAETFSSAKDFLQRQRPEGPACLVMDVRLPDCSGLQVQRELLAGDCPPPGHLHHRASVTFRWASRPSRLAPSNS